MWFLVRLSRCRLIHGFSFLVLMVRPKLSLPREKQLIYCCIIFPVLALRAKSGKHEVPDDGLLHLL